jgi:hypothetical protein
MDAPATFRIDLHDTQAEFRIYFLDVEPMKAA